MLIFNWKHNMNNEYDLFQHVQNPSDYDITKYQRVQLRYNLEAVYFRMYN